MFCEILVPTEEKWLLNMYLIYGSLQTPPPPAFEYFVTSFTLAHGGVEAAQITIALGPANA